MKFFDEHTGLATLARISNTWIVRHPAGTVLIDSGHRTERWALWRHLREIRLDAVVLTHRHCDHAGNAAGIRERHGCPVLCHADEASALAGRGDRGRLAGRGQGSFWDEALASWEDRFPAVCEVDDTFTDDVGWGFRALHVPGHTSGSVLLYHEPTQTLFTGDSILTGIPPLRSIERIRLAIPAYSLDIDGARGTTREAIRQLPHVAKICGGHGPPVTEGADAKLREL